MKLVFSLALFLSRTAFALQIYLTGAPTDVNTNNESQFCLAGGGSDLAWAEGWKKLLAATEGGDVVIVRAGSGRGGYESWLYNDEDHVGLPGINSVRTIVVEKAQDANSPDVYEAISRAELVFFAGGDQSLYVDWFRDSALLRAVNEGIAFRNLSLGGTSAGMALLAGIDFAARLDAPADDHQMVTSDDAMQDPTGNFMDLDTKVLQAPFLHNVITETHFSARSRQGRVMGLMAKALYKKLSARKSLRAIAADEGTAFCYGKNGMGEVVGAGQVYFLRPLSLPERLTPGRSLNWFADAGAVEVQVLGAEINFNTFNLLTWQSEKPNRELWWVDGRDEKHPRFGSRRLNPSAL